MSLNVNTRSLVRPGGTDIRVIILREMGPLWYDTKIKQDTSLFKQPFLLKVWSNHLPFNDKYHPFIKK